MVLTTVDDRCVCCTRGAAVFQRAHGEVIGSPPARYFSNVKHSMAVRYVYCSSGLFSLGHWYPKLSPFVRRRKFDNERNPGYATALVTRPRILAHREWNVLSGS